MTLGEKIKEARIKKKMSQTELATRLGYNSRSSINKIEVGGRDIPRSMVLKFAEVLDVSPSYLMGWENQTKEDELLQLFCRLTPEQQDLIISQIKGILMSGGKK